MFGLAGLSLRLLAHGPFFYRPGGPIDWFLQWDSRWYLTVAESGYSYDPNQMSSVNFLPLFPMLVRPLGHLFHSFGIAAYLVSNLFCLGAAGLLWRLVHDFDGPAFEADAAALFFLVCPVALFFSTAYSESTFLFFALATFIAARRENWVLAGFCGAAAALSRSVGLLLLIPLAVEFLRSHRQLTLWRRPSTWAGIICCGLPAAATAGYVAYLGWRFQDPLAYVVSQRHGGHNFGPPWNLFANPEFHDLPEFYKYWFGATAIVAVLMVIAGAVVQLPLSLTAFAAALTLLYLSTRSLEGLPRFFSVVFPFYATLGRIHAKWPSVGLSLLGVSAALMAFSVVLFVDGYWFT